MDRIYLTLLLLYFTEHFIESFPIKNGFSVKFKPLSTKEEVHPKTFGSLFAKISQEFTPEAILRREIFSKTFSGPPPPLGTGCTNQVARMMLPSKQSDNDTSDVWNGENYLNLPLIKQPYQDYKILVVTAPPDVKIGKTDEDKKVVIYVVFSEDGLSEETGTVSIPEIYFVNKPLQGEMDKKESKLEPLILIDNNRTVTGLKSKYIEKLVNFKTSFKKRYSYELTD